MYTTGEIAAEVALEKPGLDTLDIAVFWGGSPTIASTQTILFNAALSGAHYLEQNAYVALRPRRRPQPAGHPRPARGRRWRCRGAARRTPSGTAATRGWPTCKALGGVFNRGLMLAVPQIVAGAIAATEGMDAEEKYLALAATAAPVMSEMPPRENPRLNKSMDSVHASGPLGRAHCVIHGNQNYKQTGLLQAYAAYSLLQQPPRRVGFASGCQAFGHRELLGVLMGVRAGLRARPHRRGLTPVRLVDYLDKGASLGPDAPCLTTDGVTQQLRRGAGAELAHLGGPGRVRRRARRQGRGPLGQRPGGVHLRLRHQPRRRGVVPDQPAQRGRRRTATCSTCSTAPRWSSRPPSPPWSTQIRADLPALDHAGLPRRRRQRRRGRLGWEEFLGAATGSRAGRPRPARRPGRDRRHRRHDRAPQGRDAHRSPTSRR